MQHSRGEGKHSTVVGHQHLLERQWGARALWHTKSSLDYLHIRDPKLFFFACVHHAKSPLVLVKVVKFGREIFGTMFMKEKKQQTEQST